MGELADRSQNPFITQTTFEALFPELEDVVVEGTIGESLHNHCPIRFSMRARGGTIRCPNPKCFGGGFTVDHEAGDMKRAGVSEKTVQMNCLGSVNSYKGRRLGQPCPYSVQGTVTLKPKSTTTETGH